MTFWNASTSTVGLAAMAPLMALLLVAAVLDCRTRRIPNWLTFSLLAGGLLRGLLAPRLGLGDPGLPGAVLGAAAGFLLGVPLMAIGARGAGDAKLYIATGAWLGWQGVVVIFLLEAVVGLVMVVAQCAARGKLLELLRNTGLLVVTLFHLRRLGAENACASGRQFTSIDRRLPHAVPFLAATTLALAVQLL